MIGPDLNFY